MGRLGSREGAAYGTAAATAVVVVAIGLLSSCSVERAAAPTPASGPTTAASPTR